MTIKQDAKTTEIDAMGIKVRRETLGDHDVISLNDFQVTIDSAKQAGALAGALLLVVPRLKVGDARVEAAERAVEAGICPASAHRLRVAAEHAAGAWARIGDLPVTEFTPALVDKLYECLVAGDGPKLKPGRVRQAAFEMDVCKIAWRAVKRKYGDVFPEGDNAFEGLRREKRGTETKVPATVEEAYALAYALRDAGHAGLGACALIAYMSGCSGRRTRWPAR